MAWAFADGGDARNHASALLANVEAGVILKDTVEVDSPTFADESAYFAGEADADGTEFHVAYLIVRDGPTVAMWSAAGFDKDQTRALIEAADARWGDGAARPAEFETGTDPEAAMLDFVPDRADLPDGFDLIAEATTVLVEPTPSKMDRIRGRGHTARAII